MTNESRIFHVAFYGVLVIFVVLLLHGPSGFSQVAASVLKGTITDATGAILPNATVTVTSLATGTTRTLRTSSVGSYELPDLRPGDYRLSAEAAGFKTAVIPQLTLLVGETSTQDVQLQVGGQAQQVTVTATSPLLNTTSAAIGTVITSTSMTQLPLNGRNIMQLNLLSPGAATDKNGSVASGKPIDPSEIGFAVNGLGSDYNMYILDGLQIKDWQHGSAMFNPSVDAIQEFQASTSSYSAAFGSEASAQVNLVIKSGTDLLHGTAWEYLRNTDLNANNYFQPAGTKTAFNRNQFGANIGGPVMIPHLYNGKSHTFFFFDYEGYRQSKRVPETAYFPTPTQLLGNLSSVVTPGTPLMNPYTGQPFANNTIPANMIQPPALAQFLATGIGKGPWIPAPNANKPGINYILSSPSSYVANQYITRIDQFISPKTSLYGSFAWDTETSQAPNTKPSYHVTTLQDAYSAAVHFFHLIKPNLIFDMDGGKSHVLESGVQSTAFTNNITGMLGIAGNATGIPAAWGAPVWSVQGYSGLGEVNYGPELWYTNTVELRPAMTAIVKNHSFHFGMDIARVNENYAETLYSNGTYSFDGWATGYALGDFLLDLPTTINSSPDIFAPNILNWRLAPYFQDDWKMSPNLTVNLGVRYEWSGIPLSQNHRSIANIYYPPNNGVPEIVIADNASPIDYGGVQGTFFTGVPYIRASSIKLPQNLGYNYNLGYAPRVGFAYRIPGRSTKVVRAGYGIFYNSAVQDDWIEASVDPPFVRDELTSVNITNFLSFNPVNPYNYASASAAQVFGNQMKFRPGTTQEWNLTLEGTLWNTLLSIGYVGNTTAHERELADPNQAVPGPGPNTANREWPSDGVLYMANDQARSNYNGLQAKAQHRLTNGLEFLASYTWSKTFNTSDGTEVGDGRYGFGTQNLVNPNSEYGLAAQDVRDAFNLGYVYVLPFGTGRRFVTHGGFANALLGGWQVNGVITAVTGGPFSVTQTTNGANIDVGQYRADFNGNSRLAHPSVAKFFNTAAFAFNAPVNGVYKFGTEHRNAVTGPGTVDSDFALYKNFKIGERVNAQFRAETFNLFNHPIFAQPSGSAVELGAAAFGTLTATSTDNRETQVALRLAF